MAMIRFFAFASVFIPFTLTVAGTELTLPLSSGWTFRNVSGQEWNAAKVPGSVYLDLLADGRIPDPYFSANEPLVQWVDTCDWEYACSFDVPQSMLRSNHQVLEFDGLDTYAEVSLNGKSVLKADNMFRTWQVDVKGCLKAKRNVLTVRFTNASRLAATLRKSYGMALPGGDRVFLRKAAFQWGWDFAPRFNGCGIWKPVALKCWSGIRFLDLQVNQLSLTDSLAVVEVVSLIESDIPAEIRRTLSLSEISLDDNKSITIGTGVATHRDTVTIPAPRLWWPHNFGVPNLYELRVGLLLRGKEEAVAKTSVGLRTVELRQDKDSIGNAFTLVVNGIPIFMKGANIVPLDFFSPSGDSLRIAGIIDDALSSNMNMLRIWGGGVYPADAFYAACDRSGILVWQDFMAACSMLPGDTAFIANMREEVKQQVVRLRNHPSLALWCGNNESDEGWHNWGWQKEFGYSAADSVKVWNDYRTIFHEMIPEVLQTSDPVRPYWPSSPSIGWGRKESLLSGDAHYWGVWWGMEPFSVYTRKVGRFMSEYGFQGFPCTATLRDFTGTERLDTTMPALKVHQKHPTGFQTIATYLERSYNRPKDFHSYTYVTQLQQAEGVRTAIEAHRRAQPRCMGTLYWQFNDCWPGISWSSRDYYGRWKALQYQVKSAYADMIISPVISSNRQVDVYVVTDSLQDWLARMELRVIDFKGNIRWSEIVAADIKANSSSLVCSRDLSRIVQGSDTSFTFLNIRLFLSDRVVTERNIQFCLTKSLKLMRPSFTVRSKRMSDGSSAMVVRASTFVKGLEISVNGDPSWFSENYFDMMPNVDYTVPVRMKDFRDEDVSKLQYRSLFDSY